MRDRHISLTRGTSLAGHEQRVYEFLDANLPPSCGVWPGVRIRQANDPRAYTVDLLVLGHYSLYVVEIKSSLGAHVRESLDDAYEQVLQYAHLVAAAIDGESPGPRPWIEPILTLSPDPPPGFLPSLPFLLDPPALVHAAVSGELRGRPRPPTRAPLDTRTSEAVRRMFDGPGMRVRLQRLKQQLLDATPSTCETPEIAVASWVTTACFLLLAQARTWFRPQETPAGREALVAMAELPCVQTLCPHGIPRLTALPWTLVRVLLDALEPLVFLAPDDWRSSAAAWSDLYETLPSVEQREAHATIATPSFVSDFLCDWTVKPAIDAFGADVVHVLDPACGAGTMLCAAFHRLLDAGHLDPLAVLGRVHGIDIDPIAALIARTRLLTAYLERTLSPQLDRLPALPIHVTAVDSLLTEPPRHYHAVVCNPPFVTSKESSATQQYRERFPDSAHGKFALCAPFIERCFQLAEPGGFVGLFTSNSFTRRSFGKHLIEVVLAKLDVGPIIDTSGVFIPGSGIPTLLVFGQNRPPASNEITIVFPKLSEPAPPTDPAEGRVWQAIVQHHANPGYEDDQIAVNRVPRSQLFRHPMDLTRGPARAILDVLEAASSRTLRSLTRTFGSGAVSGSQVFIHEPDTLTRMGIEPCFVRPFVRGDSFSPWMVHPTQHALALEQTPTDETQRTTTAAWRYLLRYRSILEQRPSLARRPIAWWRWLRWNTAARGERPTLLVPSIARVPQFVLAPVDTIASTTVVRIELSPLDDDTLYALLAYLNSTAVRFWLAHHCARLNHNIRLDASSLEQLPIPDAVLHPGPLREILAALAGRLHDDACALTACAPGEVVARWGGNSRASLLDALADAQAIERRLLRHMVRAQEDIDWTVYRLLALFDEPGPPLDGSALPEHRPHAWRGSQPPTALDPRLVTMWSRRRAAITESPALRLLESPVYKTLFDRSNEHDESSTHPSRRARRPASTTGYRQQLTDAVLNTTRWRIEAAFAEQDCPHGLSVASITALLTRSAPVRAILSLVPNATPDNLVREVARVLEENATPYLSALRYTRSGLAKRAAWEHHWDTQSDPTPRLPLYTPEDYPTASIWRHRGELDDERESFIAYPRATPDGATLYGWAGWRTDIRASVLWAMYAACSDAGGSHDALTPLLAGLYDLTVDFALLSDVDHQSKAISAEARRMGISVDELHSFRPPAATP